eukprot:4477270-Pyramimonas_sp.AAC.1
MWRQDTYHTGVGEAPAQRELLRGGLLLLRPVVQVAAHAAIPRPRLMDVSGHGAPLRLAAQEKGCGAMEALRINSQ